MPNLKGHILGGVLLFPVYYTAFWFFERALMNSRFDPGIEIITLAYIFFLIGSDLPDMDAKFAPIRIITRAFIPLIFLAVVWNQRTIFMEFLEGWMGDWANPFLLATTVIIGYTSGSILEFLKHRGFLHTNSFGLVYSIVCYSIGRFAFGLSGSELVFTTFSGFFGVLTHLILDYKFRAVLRWL